MSDDIFLKKHFHFIGIGGIGMSALARIMLETGYRVSGSDTTLNDLTRSLASRGSAISKGHRASNLPADADAVVYSSSVPGDNPELVEARKRGIAIIRRGCLLAELLNRKKGIAVAGTHGKTTTTAMVSVLLTLAGLDPTAAIGGEVLRFGSNARVGSSDWLVAESDESDGSFLYLKPHIAIMTNAEMEHSDYYRSLADVINAYRTFAGNVQSGGMIIYYEGDANLAQAVGKRGDVTIRTYGLTDRSTVYPADLRVDRCRVSYTCMQGPRPLGEITIQLPGMHNVLNSLAAVLVGMSFGIDIGRIAEYLGQYDGTKRRFQIRVNSDDVTVIEDYAHHPTEIRAVLDAVRPWKRRTIVVFQPHRYTRTKYFIKEFGGCFNGVDKLIFTDIYAASEPPIEGINISSVYDEAVRNGVRDVSVVPKKDISQRIMSERKKGDLILILGAGDIRTVADELTDMIGHEMGTITRNS